MNDWKCASVKGWPERMMAAKSHSMSSAAISKRAWFNMVRLTFIEIGLVEIVRLGDIHVIEACNLDKLSMCLHIMAQCIHCGGL